MNTSSNIIDIKLFNGILKITCCKQCYCLKLFYVLNREVNYLRFTLLLTLGVSCGHYPKKLKNQKKQDIPSLKFFKFAAALQ